MSTNQYKKPRLSIITIIIAILSLTISVFLSHKIYQGQKKLSQGIIQLQQGKKRYQEAQNNPLLVLGDGLLAGGNNFKTAKELIKNGEKQIFYGKIKLGLAGFALIFLLLNVSWGFYFLMRPKKPCPEELY